MVVFTHKEKNQIFKPKAYGGPISGPVNICKSNLTYFSVSDSCDEVQNGFRSAYFSCQGRTEQSKVAPEEGGSGGGGGPAPVCKTINDWVKRAVDGCANICQNPSPSPTSTESNRCNVHDGDVRGCDATPGCAYYYCSNKCFLRGTSNDIACATSSGQ